MLGRYDKVLTLFFSNHRFRNMCWLAQDTFSYIFNISQLNGELMNLVLNSGGLLQHVRGPPQVRQSVMALVIITFIIFPARVGANRVPSITDRLYFMKLIENTVQWFLFLLIRLLLLPVFYTVYTVAIVMLLQFWSKGLDAHSFLLKLFYFVCMGPNL